MVMLDSYRRFVIVLILALLALVSGCGGGNPPTVDPCITDPNLSGCNIGDTSGSVSIDQITSPIITSSVLNDLIDITQIALVSVVKSYDYKTEIQTVDQTQQTNIFDPISHNNAGTAPFQHTLNCDNNNTYDVTINDFKAPNIMEGKTVTVIFNDKDGGIPNPELTCQFGNTNLRGFFHLTRIVISENPAIPGSWSLDGELWPTITIHDGNYRAFISNPIHLVADYTPSTGLSLTGTVMDSSIFSTQGNPYTNNPTVNTYINGVGIVVTHYPAGTDMNTSPFTTYNILLKDFAITAHLDTIDTATASQLSMTTDGTIVGDITGTDLYLNIQSDAANPIAWDKLGGYDLVPKLIPAKSGTLLIQDTGIGSSSLMTITDSTGKLTLTVVDNTLPSTDPAQTTINDSNWLILTRHLGQPGVI